MDLTNQAKMVRATQKRSQRIEMVSTKGKGLISWQHPGGKLRELGADTLADAELLAILISTGIKGKTSEDLANELLKKFGGNLENLVGKPLENFLEIKGLSDVKIIRIAAAFELARRVSRRKSAKKK